MGGVYLPVWKRLSNGKVYRAGVRQNNRDQRWLDTLDDKTVIEDGNIFTTIVEPAAGKNKGKQKYSGGKITKCVKQRACWLNAIEYKIKGHGDSCACITAV